MILHFLFIPTSNTLTEPLPNLFWYVLRRYPQFCYIVSVFSFSTGISWMHRYLGRLGHCKNATMIHNVYFLYSAEGTSHMTHKDSTIVEKKPSYCETLLLLQMLRIARQYICVCLVTTVIVIFHIKLVQSLCQFVNRNLR